MVIVMEKKESGRGKPKMYQELARKYFWEKLTGDEDFYIKIIEYMGVMPEQYVVDYRESYNRATNRLVREFSNSFCKEDGSIDWEKLLEFRGELLNIIENGRRKIGVIFENFRKVDVVICTIHM